MVYMSSADSDSTTPVKRNDESDSLMASYMLNGISSMVGAYSQSQALKAQDEHQIKMAKMNEALAAFNAQITIEKGNEDANALLRKAGQLKGKQKAAFAAQGIDSSSGSAADILRETDTNAAMDALTIRNNAWRQAWGFGVEAANTRLKSDLASAANQNMARNTLVTGAFSAAEQGLKASYYSKKRLSQKDDGEVY